MVVVSNNDEIVIRQQVFLKFLHVAYIYPQVFLQNAADKLGISARLTCLTIP